MNHAVVIWLALVCGSVLTGASVVALLTSERSLEPLSAASVLIGFTLAAWGFAHITTTYVGIEAVGYGLLFGMGAVAGGYALASTLLAHLALHPKPPSLPRILPPATQSPAILLLAELEPRNYSARSTAAALEDLSEEGLLEASIWVLPFLFMAQKTRYRAAGGTSPGSGELESVAEKLAATLRSRGVTDVQTAACQGERSLARSVAAAVERGFRTIVVAQAVVAESLEVDRAKREVDALRLGELGISVTYADPLWGSSRCASLVAAKAIMVAGDLTTCGIVLVGQAQPEERSRITDVFDHQETGFLNQVRMLLIERGIPEHHVHIAWADWRTPEVTGSVRHLAALGCRTVVVVPACFPLDSITTMLDLPLAVRQARADQSVRVLTLQAWYDDPGLTDVLRTRTLHALDLAEQDGAAGS